VKILIVEDETNLREGLVDLLRSEGHLVEAVADGEAALDRGSDPSIQLMLLDLMLPKLDGIEVCKRLRELRPDLQILMLTARGSEDEKVNGLDAGADDYVTKPFSLKELVARINALGRRAQSADQESRLNEAKGCRIDLGRCIATLENGDEINLTAREASILRWLYQHRSRAVSRAELLEVVWGTRGDLQTRTVDMTIANLRQKVEADPSNPRLVVTVKGVGYAWGER
jgi:DNA-binding response OmpR family regulator